MPLSPHEFLRHILDEIDYVQRTSEQLSKAEYLCDETLQRSFVRSLEIIGEAAKKLPSDWRQEHGGIEWRAIAGMRDRLIHNYFAVDHDIVWDVIQHKLSDLKRHIEEILGGHHHS